MTNQRMISDSGLAILNAGRLQKAQRSRMYLKMSVLLLLSALHPTPLLFNHFPSSLRLAARNDTGFLATTQSSLSCSHDILYVFLMPKAFCLTALCCSFQYTMISSFPMYFGKVRGVFKETNVFVLFNSDYCLLLSSETLELFFIPL